MAFECFIPKAVHKQKYGGNDGSGIYDKGTLCLYK